MSYYTTNEQFIHEHKPYTVTCKQCGKTETASQMSLQVSGWQLTDLGEVCDRCTKRIVRENLQNARHATSLVNRLQHPPAFVPFEGYPMSEVAK